MNIVLDLSKKLDWNSYLTKLPINQQDIYYLPDYYYLYEKNGDGKAQCFIFEQSGEIALYPFLINSVNELGYQLDKEYFDIQGAYGYNGVISSTTDKLFINDFYKAFNNYCKEQNIIAEFTRFHPVLNNYKFSDGNLNIIFDRKTVILDLILDYNDIWEKEYSSKNRNMIKKAGKMGVTSYISQDKNDYNEFIKLYAETMKNVGATDYYYFDKTYFDNIRQRLNNNQHLIVSKINNKLVGGMILFTYGDYAHYHLSARNSEFGKYAINNHFLDYAIKTAKEQGCKQFHFGGGNSTDEKDSLLKFKTNFSKDKSDFYIGKKIHNYKVYQNIVDQWEEKNPSKKESLKNILLKYRM